MRYIFDTHPDVYSPPEVSLGDVATQLAHLEAGLIGFKLDRYDPKVDSEPGLTGTPYHDVFGTRRPLRYQLEFDWEVAHPFGALLIGATAGFWQNYGKAILRSSPPGVESVSLRVRSSKIRATRS